MDPPLPTPTPVEHLDPMSQPYPLYPPTSLRTLPPPFPRQSSQMASPPDVGVRRYSKTQMQEIPSNGTLGQFSFAPATQTTVVTTTTTTTTSFPPFVIPPPGKVNNLDPKAYPLASTPTPSSIRKLCMTVEGKPTYFEEAEDTSLMLKQILQEQSDLRAANGKLQTVRTYEPRYEADPTPISKQTRRDPTTNAIPRRRPVSPVSISEAVNAVRQNTLNGSTSRRSAQNGQSVREGWRSGTRLIPSLLDERGPATPDPDSQASSSDRARGRKSANRQDSSRRSRLDTSPIQSSEGQQATPQTLSPRQSVANVFLPSFSDDTPILERQTRYNLENGRNTASSHARFDPADTSDSAMHGVDTEPDRALQGRRIPASIPSRLAIDNSVSQDLSLPSPSLSPVTAAANLQQSTRSFGPPDDSQTDVEHTSFNLSSQLTDVPMDSALSLPRLESAHHDATQQPIQTLRMQGKSMESSLGSLTDIPGIINLFEAFPDEMKTYVMYQLLRRCPKPTLHFVADIVNPALKCDFLALLPIELSLNVIRYLDVKSMCSASQVSKKWRRVVDSDEKAWKDLFDKDGYVLPEGELQRAIQEGWGWQHPSGANGCERDLSIGGATKIESDWSFAAGVLAQNGDEEPAPSPTPSSSRRPKRKAAAKTISLKKQKRKDAMVEDPDKPGPSDWMCQAAAVEGPYAAANAAALAVPYPSAGLPSLKNLHLYKSLYRRHYLIRRSWMMEDIKPRHIAFRAHDRHVVTCLQFDTDKILTGSDDTNINVYDTKTGALRQRLQGHEGGVWALQYEGNVLVSGSTDRSVRVWDIEKGLCMQVFHGHTSTVRCLQILMPTEVGRMPDGTVTMMPKQPLIITGSRDSNLRVWKLPQPGDSHYFQAGPPQDDTDCPYFVRTLAGHQHSVRAIAAHADTLVSGSYDCTVRVWKISTGETLHRLQGHTQKVYSVVLDHKRNRCISGSMDNMVKIWSLDTGSVLYNLEGHSSLVGLLDLNSDRLVSAAADSTLRIWDPENGQCKSTLTAHTGAITCFQHDAQKVISGSDRTLKMWNVKTGDCVKDLLTDLSGVWQVKFNERRCVAAVQRNSMTYIEVLDFGASRDGILEEQRGKRIVVDGRGQEFDDTPDAVVDLDNDD